MTQTLRILPRAVRDAQHIFDWIAERSPGGALRWWQAFEKATNQLVNNPQAHALAPENSFLEPEIRQFLFGTLHGKTYRGIFTLMEDEIRILRVRGPGQPPLMPDEVAENS